MFKLLGPSLKSRKSLKIIEEYYLIVVDNQPCAPRLSAYEIETSPVVMLYIDDQTVWVCDTVWSIVIAYAN